MHFDAGVFETANLTATQQTLVEHIQWNLDEVHRIPREYRIDLRRRIRGDTDLLHQPTALQLRQARVQNITAVTEEITNVMNKQTVNAFGPNPRKRILK